MNKPSHAESFRLVFDGRLVAGRNAAQIEAEFARRFGAETAQKLFSGKTVTLNRNIDRQEAQKRQRYFEQLGIVVQIVPSAPVTADLSLVDAPVKPATRPSAETTRAAETSRPRPADIGVLPDRSPPRPATAQAAGVYTTAELAAAFRDAAEFPRASRSYLVRLLPVAMLMLFLPLVYVGITVVSGAATVWIAVQGFSWVFDGLGYFRVVAYCAGTGGILLLTVFLLRPFVARVEQGPQPVRLDPQREPILFELVDRITDAVGAPMPQEILVDSDANASARLTRGAFSRGLTLTVGMPLIYGLDLQSLTGVLAHEFGHFTQRAGMRLSALVYRINYWFYRQVYERDSWDRFVDKWSEGNSVLALAAMLARLGSFLVRLLLQLLSTLAAFFSFSLSRQMEFDADRYEIGLVGSAAYERTCTMMRVLGAAQELAVTDLSMAFDSDSKIDNLPKFAALKAANLTEQQRRAIIAMIEEVNASPFDTHPPDKERLRRALDADMPARFVHAGPAVKLLREPDRLGKLVTLQWYRSFGVEVSPDDLTPVEAFASETDLLNDAQQSISEYFGELDGNASYLRLPRPGSHAQLDDAGLRRALQDVTAKLRQGEAEYLRLQQRMDEDIEYQGYYRQALFWRRAGFDIDLNAYRLPLTTADIAEISDLLREYKASESEARAALRPCLKLQGQRLALGLELAERHGEIDRSELDVLRRAHLAMASNEDELARLLECGATIDLLLQVLEALPNAAKYRRQLDTENAAIQKVQRSIRSSLANVADPFAAGTSLADVLPNESAEPGPREPVAALDDAARIYRSHERTGYKIVGRIAAIALAAERQLKNSQ